MTTPLQSTDDTPPQPVPVIIESPEPVPVRVVPPPGQLPPPPGKRRPDEFVQRQSTDPSLPARTTFQEDLTFASQRRVNLIWERTQAAIALVVVLFTMVCGTYGMLHNQSQIPTIMSVAFGTVVGFYFSRTNHTATGGIGPRPKIPGSYKGR